LGRAQLFVRAGFRLAPESDAPSTAGLACFKRVRQVSMFLE